MDLKKNGETELIIVGSVALDSIETPWASKKGILGGSASYACVAASFFTRPGMIGIVGSDFPVAYTELFERMGIDLRGLQREKAGNTFRWSGVYEKNMDNRRTLLTELGVFAEFSPVVPAAYKKAPFVFLANIAPALQLNVLSRMEQTTFVAADTMDLWINTTRNDLLELIPKTDLLMLNDSEIIQLTEETDAAVAAERLLGMGLSYVVVKKGAQGSMLFSKNSVFSLPAVPISNVTDPTGAGDCFAGAFMGYIAGHGDCSEQSLRSAMTNGTALASFCVEAFSPEGLEQVDAGMIEERIALLKKMTEDK